MSMDEALESLGRWGRWQLITYFLICIFFCIPSTWQLFAIVFIGIVSPHHCRPGWNQTIEEAVPLEYSTLHDAWVYSSCYQYVNRTVDNSTEACTNGWDYDPVNFTPDTGTIVMEWDLVCDRDGYVETSQTIFNVGVAAGALLFTPLADRFGRKVIFFISEILMNVFGIALSFSPNYPVFCTIQFLTGLCSQGLFMTGFVMACELFPASLRAVMAQSAYFFYAIGNATLALWAYWLRDWRSLQLAISIPPLIAVVYWRWCPESLRWLSARGNTAEVHRLLENAARINKVDIKEEILKKACAENQDEAVDSEASILKMLKSPRPRRYMLIMLFLMLTNNLMYFGLSLMTSSFTGDLYLIFLGNALLEIPGTFFAILFTKYYGRRWPLCGFHLFAAIFMVLSAISTTANILPFVSNALAVTILALIAKLGVSGSWCIELIYAQEIYPTVLRSTGLGLTGGIGFIGAILAPYSAFVFRKYDWIPGTLFGILSLAAAILAPFCPETQGRALPTTIEEIENWSLTLTPEENLALRSSARPKCHIACPFRCFQATIHVIDDSAITTDRYTTHVQENGVTGSD